MVAKQALLGAAVWPSQWQ